MADLAEAGNWKRSWKMFYPPSKCSLKIRSNARQSSKIVYNWAYNIIPQLREAQIATFLQKNYNSFKPLTPASTAIGLPRWSISNSSSSMLLLIKDVILGIRALITDSKCYNQDHNISLISYTNIILIGKRDAQGKTFERSFARYSEPILLAKCPYSGLVAKYSRSLRLAAIMSTFLLMSAWERLTIPTQGCCKRYDLPSITWEHIKYVRRKENKHFKTSIFFKEILNQENAQDIQQK